MKRRTLIGAGGLWLVPWAGRAQLAFEIREAATLDPANH